MNNPNPLNDVVNQILVQTIQAAKDGAEWIKGQIPDVLHQFLLYKTFSLIIHEIIWLLGFTLIPYMSYQFLKKKAFSNASWSSHEGYISLVVFTTALSVVVVILSVANFIIAIDDIIKIIVAPKIYLLDYAKTLLSK